jgi:hypothetical protein
MVIDPLTEEDLQPDFSSIDPPELHQSLDHLINSDFRVGAVDLLKDLRGHRIQRRKNHIRPEEIFSHLLPV